MNKLTQTNFIKHLSALNIVSKTHLVNTESNNVKLSNAKANNTKPNNAKPSNTNHNDKDLKLIKTPLYHAVVSTFCLVAMFGAVPQSSHADAHSMATSTAVSEPYPYQVNTIFTSDIQLFNHAHNPSADNQAKALLLTALQEHLERERTTVSQMRYQVTPYVNDELESDAQSLFRTFIELRAYQDDVYGVGSDYSDGYGDSDTSQDSKPAYRTREAYLQGNEDKLYIRYDDEINDTMPTPDYRVTREVGMSDAYKERSSAIHYYAYNQDDCVIDYSVALDNLVNEDATFTTDNEQLNTLKDSYNECVLDVKQEYKSDIDNAVGYQTTYAPIQDQCAAMYHRDIAVYLSPNRRASDINYDEYDSVYQSYRVCYDLIADKQELEPNYYTYFEKSQETLDFGVAKIECAEDLFAKQDALRQQGFTLANSPDKYASIYYNDYSTCVFDAEQNILYATDYNVSNDDTTDDEASDAEDSYDNDTNYEASNYEDYDYETYEKNAGQEYTSGADKFNQDLANLNIAGFLEDYRNMKAKQQAEGNDGSEQDLDKVFGSGSMMSVSMFILDFMQRTPEQLQARNYYAYEPLTIRTVSRYQPSRQRYSALYSYDFDTPVYKASVQMPVELDFKQTKLTFDPSALLPVMAMIAPESIPLPDEMDGKVVTFSLPKGMSDIPTHVLQQSFIDAVQQGFAELNPAYFTEMSLQDDSYARQVGASRGVKVYLGSKQSGEMIGKVIKNLTQDLSAYIDAHPNQYPEGHPIRVTIENWSLYNQGFQSKDVGSILQFIEAIAPISFDGFNYFYLDNHGKLIAKQSRTEFASYLSQSNYSVVRQSRFDTASFERAPYSDRLDTLFFTERDGIDGNAWLESTKQKDALIKEARYARYEYDMPDYADEYDEIYGYDYAEEIIEDNDDQQDKNTNDINDIKDNKDDKNEQLNSAEQKLNTSLDIENQATLQIQVNRQIKSATTSDQNNAVANDESDVLTSNPLKTQTEQTSIVTTTTIVVTDDIKDE